MNTDLIAAHLDQLTDTVKQMKLLAHTIIHTTQEPNTCKLAKRIKRQCQVARDEVFLARCILPPPLE